VCASGPAQMAREASGEAMQVSRGGGPGKNRQVTVSGASTAVSWPGRLRQTRSFFRNRSPDQMLATAAPLTSPWLPPGYEQNFWNAA